MFQHLALFKNCFIGTFGADQNVSLLKSIYWQSTLSAWPITHQAVEEYNPLQFQQRNMFKLFFDCITQAKASSSIFSHASHYHACFSYVFLFASTIVLK